MNSASKVMGEQAIGTAHHLFRAVCILALRYDATGISRWT
jgi:hypothetical protein